MRLVSVRTYKVGECGYFDGEELVINIDLISTIKKFRDNTYKTLYKISVGNDVVYVDKDAIQKIMESIK